MRFCRGITGAGALALLLLAPQPAPAAWNNVFQVTCHGCRKRPVVAAYAAPVVAMAPACPAPCPQQVQYVQRTMYTPVTTYEPVCTTVPVQSNYTSYYWEPVRSYTYSSYYDPCTCTCQSVATPVCSYRLRSQCNSVTNYVQRISYRPVVTMRQSCYMEAVPVNPCPPNPCPPAAPVPMAAAPAGPIVAVPQPGMTPPLNLQTPEPALNEQRTLPNAAAPPPALGEDRSSYFGNTIPPLTGQSLRPVPVRPTPTPNVPVRPGQIAMRPTSNGPANLSGQVVANNFTPRGGAQMVFVSAQKQDVRLAATADRAGRFQVDLPAGGWYVYLAGADGKATYHSQLIVKPSESKNVTVVSR
jgi:hypothetical protein